MHIEYFEREKEWDIPFVELRKENAELFIHYDIVEDENDTREMSEGDREADGNAMRLVAPFVRVPYPVDAVAIADACIANDCDASHAEDVARETMCLMAIMDTN